MMKIDLNEIVSIKDATRLSGYEAGYLRDLARTGKIKSIKIGNSVFLYKESLLQYASSHDRSGEFS